MREILFRGKRTDNGEWVEGFFVKRIAPLKLIPKCYILVQEEDTSCITGEPTGHLNTEFSPYVVIPETISQYTGLKDKNGKRIFEGDIVKGEDALLSDIEIFGYVCFKDGSFVISDDLITHYRWIDYEVEVIGNIYDNPELLEIK